MLRRVRNCRVWLIDWFLKQNRHLSTERFATLPVRHLDGSLPGRLATWTLRTFRRFDTRTYRYLPGRYATLRYAFVICDIVSRLVGAELPATNRVPRRRIWERPSDMEVSCEISGQPWQRCPTNKQSWTMQRQSHENADVVDGRRYLPLLKYLSARSMTTLRHGEFEPPSKSSKPTYRAIGRSMAMQMSVE